MQDSTDNTIINTCTLLYDVIDQKETENKEGDKINKTDNINLVNKVLTDEEYVAVKNTLKEDSKLSSQIDQFKTETDCN